MNHQDVMMYAGEAIAIGCLVWFIIKHEIQSTRMANRIIEKRAEEPPADYVKQEVEDTSEVILLREIRDEAISTNSKISSLSVAVNKNTEHLEGLLVLIGNDLIRMIERLGKMHLSIDEARDYSAQLLAAQHKFVRSLQELTGMEATISDRRELSPDQIQQAKNMVGAYGITMEEAQERILKTAVYMADHPMGGQA